MIEWKKDLSPTTTSKGTAKDNMYQLLGGAVTTMILKMIPH